MQLNLKKLVMEPRPDWNLIGPRLPAYFRLALSRIDPQLVMQFMPPNDYDAKGVSAEQFPWGVWVVCRRMRGTPWLYKRWQWSLSDSLGKYLPPGSDTLRLLKHARDLWRRGREHVLERTFERSLAAAKSERISENRHARVNEMADVARRLDFERRDNRVSMNMSKTAKRKPRAKQLQECH